MAQKSLNRSLHAAKASKNDEFYTQLSDIEKELKHYATHLEGKTVLCNCDDPRESQFFHYFSYNFQKLGLKKLIATCYKSSQAELFSNYDSEAGLYLEYKGDKKGSRVPDPAEIGIHHLKGDGDFRSKECIRLLKQADVVVTNPPFSLFREYIDQLAASGKKFLIIGTTTRSLTRKYSISLKRTRFGLGTASKTGMPISRSLLAADSGPRRTGFRGERENRSGLKANGIPG